MKELKDISLIDFEKLSGLVPAVVQDNQTQKVLMVGFMNADAVKSGGWGYVNFPGFLLTHS